MVLGASPPWRRCTGPCRIQQQHVFSATALYRSVNLVSVNQSQARAGRIRCPPDVTGYNNRGVDVARRAGAGKAATVGPVEEEEGDARAGRRRTGPVRPLVVRMTAWAEAQRLVMPLTGVVARGNARHPWGRMFGDDGGGASSAATAAATTATEKRRRQRAWVWARHKISPALPSSFSDTASGRRNRPRRHACRRAVPLGRTLIGLQLTAPEEAGLLDAKRAGGGGAVTVSSFETGTGGGAHDGRRHTWKVCPAPLVGASSARPNFVEPWSITVVAAYFLPDMKP